MALCTQACKSIAETDLFQENEIDEAALYCKLSARLPSDEQRSDTRVLLEGDAPSSPIVLKWQGSTSDFKDRFAIIGYDRDGNIAHVTDAVRSAKETEDSISGTFEFSIDTDYWIEDLEYRYFYPFYPIKEYDLKYYSGSDDDIDHWVYKFSEQSGHFEDLPNYLFMTGPEINLEDPSVEFQYGVAILRLSDLCIPDLKGHTVSNIKVKSNAIKDAVSYRYSFSDYYAASNQVLITGEYDINENGIIEDNLYLVFYPSTDTIEYLYISVENDGKMYSYSYSGNLENFSAGKVYTLRNARLFHKDTSPDYAWYLNPVGENRYEIATAKDFLGFQKIVNGDEDALSILGLEEADKFESKTIDIVAGSTIDLSEVSNLGDSWSPIEGFKGTLNGNGATITNLYINESYQKMNTKIGLFASLEYATVSSLSISGTIDANASYNGYIGGLVGYSVESSILNCTTEVSLSISNGYTNFVGGLVGIMNRNNYPTNSVLIGCLDYSTINVKTQSRDTDYVGGLIGRTAGSNSVVLACCHLNSPITVSSYSQAGGIIGNESLYNYSSVSACFNSGKISANSSGRGGQIHGGSGNTTPISSLNIASCYYSGSGAGAGIAMISQYPMDSGTHRVSDEAGMIAACDEMNSKIDEWNTSNPTIQCSRRYYVENNQIVFY